MSSHKRRISDLLEDESFDRQSRQRVDGQSYCTLRYHADTESVLHVHFRQPVPLITFSYTPSRELVFTNSALRYYVDPPIGADLKYGYERWVKRPEEKGRIDGLLKAISRARTMAPLDSAEQWSIENTDVVSWRGVMTKILTAPYAGPGDRWELNVMDVDGTLYFEEHLTDAALVEKEDMTPHHRLQSYYGYSFESWCTSSKPSTQETLGGHPPGWGGDVDTNVQWCGVVKSSLGDHSMIIGGEVDCVRGKYNGDTRSLVELKTSLTIRNANDQGRFEKKFLKFYFQSFLLGVPEIIVGFRTPSGELRSLQSFQTMNIPSLAIGKNNAWDPRVCLDWGHRFMSALKDVVRQAVHNDTDSSEASRIKVWRAAFGTGSGVNVSLLDDAGVREVEAGEDRVGFLPRWYWDELRREPRATRPQDTGGSSQGRAPRRVPAGWKI